MKQVYLDLNVFDQIEKRDRFEGDQKMWVEHLYNQITSEEIDVPYSNAHINDLKRGYIKNPQYTSKHLENIKDLTNDLCIANYWGDQGVTWHYRDINEFFETSLSDASSEVSSFEEFLDTSEFGFIFKWQVLPLKLKKLPDDFRQKADSEPLLKAMFPKAYQDLTEYALCEDVFQLNNLFSKDYTIFKKLKSYIVSHKQKLKKQEKVFKILDQLEKVPGSLTFDEHVDMYIERSKTSKNPQLQTVTTLYFRLNFEGFKADEIYTNSIDDSLHVLYASECDYFITNDDRCAHKAKEVYKKLRIKTQVLSPEEYYNQTCNQTN